MKSRLLSTILLTAVLPSFLLARSSTAQELPPPRPYWEYHLGQGLRVADTGLTIGGYGTIQYEDPHNRPRRFAASALSVFLSWDTGTRVHFFSELELEDFAVAQEGRSFGSRSRPFELERLYADVYVSEAFVFRLGKFLTPIGRWNLVHPDPLVWTTSRPLATFRSFGLDTTGGMLYGTFPTFGRELDYSAYAEVTDELHPDQREGPFSEAAGFHVVSHLGSTELGVSYSSFKREEEHQEREHLFGMDFFWTRQRFELTGEFIYRLGDRGPDADEWGLFAQGTVPLSDRLFAIGRYEFFAARGPLPGMHLWVAGLAFRPLPPLIVKAEYSIGHNNSAKVPEGFATSISLLF